MTAPSLLDRVEQLAALYPQRPVEPETIAGYCRALADLPLELVDQACNRLVTRLDWFPTVAQIRAEVVALVFRPPVAQEAWGLVLQEVRRVGYSGTPEFAMPMIERVVRSIGWRELCLSEEIDQVARRFERAYDQLVKRALEDAQVDLTSVLDQSAAAPQLQAAGAK